MQMSCRIATVQVEKFQISFHVKTDLDEFGMTVDHDAIGFRLLDFDPVFKNNGFVVLCGFGHRNRPRLL